MRMRKDEAPNGVTERPTRAFLSTGHPYGISSLMFRSVIHQTTCDRVYDLSFQSRRDHLSIEASCVEVL